MRYPFHVYKTQVEEHVFWVAESRALKGCVGQGDTPEMAIAELDANEQSWLELAEMYGMEIPAVPMDNINAYSGKLTLRVAPYVHQEAAELAKKQNISLNQYINDAIVAQNTRISTVGYITPEIKKAVKYVKELMSMPSESFSHGSTSLLRLDPRNTSRGYKVELAPYMIPAGTQ